MTRLDVRDHLRGLRPPRLHVPLGGVIRIVGYGLDELMYAHGTSGDLRRVAISELQGIVDEVLATGRGADGSVEVPLALWRDHRRLVAGLLTSLPSFGDLPVNDVRPRLERR